MEKAAGNHDKSYGKIMRNLWEWPWEKLQETVKKWEKPWEIHEKK